MNKSVIDELTAHLADLIPATDELRREARAKVEQTLKNRLKDLDVLTREEFDAQARTLARAQERVRELELLITDLELRINNLEQPDDDQVDRCPSDSR